MKVGQVAGRPAPAIGVRAVKPPRVASPATTRSRPAGGEPRRASTPGATLYRISGRYTCPILADGRCGLTGDQNLPAGPRLAPLVTRRPLIAPGGAQSA